MTTQTPATAEFEKWLRIRVWKKTEKPAGIDSGSGPTSDSQLQVSSVAVLPI